ncbi:MAG: YncE family protein [Bacillaceae bacterium]|nr:YncE family protein [Bacillaceae bacterium]
MNKNNFNSKLIGAILLLLILLLAACSQPQSTPSNDNTTPANQEEQTTEIDLEENEDVQQEKEKLNYIVTVANEKDNTLSVIQFPEKEQNVIELSGKAHNVEVNKETGLIWVTITPGHDNTEDTGESDTDAHNDHHPDNAILSDESVPHVVAYDVKTLEKVELYPVGAHPAHVTTSTDGNIVIATNAGDNTVTIINREEETTETVEVGQYPHGLRISPDQKYAYVANMNSADVSIIDIASTKEITRLSVGNGAVQTGFSHDGKYAFVGLHVDNQLAVIDTSSNEVIEKIDVGIGPVQMYASYDNKYVVVANQGSEESPSNSISIIDLEELKVVKEITLGLGAHGVVITSDSRYAFITNMFEETISVVDLKTLEEVERIDVGLYPNGISVY